MPRLILIIHNVRSAHNVGSLLRTADGLGVTRVYLTGYTPYPQSDKDERLPHLAAKVHRRIQKTALGAESSVDWRQAADIAKLVAKLKAQKIMIAALEQTPTGQAINGFRNAKAIALIVGSERGGLTPEVLKLCDLSLQIPVLGNKESYNVAVAGAIGLYHLKFIA